MAVVEEYKIGNTQIKIFDDSITRDGIDAALTRLAILASKAQATGDLEKCETGGG